MLMVIAAAAETAVTAAGVYLVYHTLKEAKRSADESGRGADEMKRSADAAVEAFGLARDEFVSTHRPRIHLRRAFNVYLLPGVIPATLEFANRGETDAIVQEIGIDLFVRRKGQPVAYFPGPQPVTLTIPPGRSEIMGVHGKSTPSVDDINDIVAGYAELCLLAIVNYDDGNGLRRQASAFRVYSTDKKRFFHVPDDDEFAEWDYED